MDMTMGKRLLSAGVVMFGLSIDATAQESAEAIVAGWISDLESLEFLTVSHGGVNTGAGDAVSVSDLSISFEIDPGSMNIEIDEEEGVPESFSYEIEIPQLTFSGLSLDDGTYAASEIATDEITLTMNADIEDGGRIVSETRIEDYVITDASWDQLPEVAEDPARPVSRFYPLAEAMFTFGFESATIGAATAENRTDPPTMVTSMSYGQGFIGETVNGDISEMSFEGFELTSEGVDPDGNQASFEMSTGSLSAEGYNYGTLIRAFAPGGAAPDGAYQPAITSIVMPDLELSGTVGEEQVSFTASVGEISMTDIGVRPPSVEVLTGFDQLAVAAMEDDAAEPDPREIVQLVGGLYGAFRLGAFEVSDVSVEVPEIASFVLGEYALRDLSADGLAEFYQAGLRFDGPEGFFSRLDESWIRDVGFPGLEALMNLEAAQKDGDVTAILEAIPTIGSLNYTGLEITVPGEVEMSLGKGQIDMSGHIGPIPTAFNLEIENLEMPVSQMEEEPREQLQALGYNHIDASVSLSGQWSEEDGTIGLASAGELADGGAFSAAAAVGGIQRAVFENPQAAGPGAIFTAVFGGAEFSFEDKSIRDRALKLIAAQQGSEPEMIKQMAIGMVPFVMAQLNRPDFAKTVSAAVSTFLQGEGKLSVKAEPSAPLPLLQLATEAQADPGTVIDKLNLTIDAR